MCIYFRKHSCLTDAFNEQINLYINSGLMNNWVSQFSQRKYLEISTTHNQRNHKALEVSQFSGTFLLCFSMISITVVIFALELLSQKYRTIRIFFKLFE